MSSRTVNDKYQKSYISFFGWSPPVFTYIITSEEHRFIKIGSSATPSFRLSSLQTGSPFLLKIVWCWPEDIESDLHKIFADKWVFGEWFDIPVDEAVRIAGIESKKKFKQQWNSQS
jgi:hypothetical protein